MMLLNVNLRGLPGAPHSSHFPIVTNAFPVHAKFAGHIPSERPLVEDLISFPTSAFAVIDLHFSGNQLIGTERH